MYLEKTETSKTEQSQIHSAAQRFNLRSRLRLVDHLTIGYVGLLAIVLTFFHEGVRYWPLLVATHVLFIAALLLFIRFVETTRRSRILVFLRDTYPFFLYTFFFKEVSVIVNVFFPFWLESWLIKWDLFLFGDHPTVWVESFFRPWLTEVMALSYWSYYVFIPFVAVLLYIRHRSLFYSYVFYISLTFYVCYFSFLFLTARGPHEVLSHLHSEYLITGFFAGMVDMIQSTASISGAAFPSSHVAAVWIAWLFVYRFRRRFGLITLPLIVSLSVSVVYMQYHYAVDSIAGMLLAFLTYRMAGFLESRYGGKETTGVSCNPAAK